MTIIVLMMALLPGIASAAMVLSCKLDQGGVTQTLDFLAAKDPYSAKEIDINGRFRFKAVVVGNANHIEYIKLYTYIQSSRQPVLLHEANYLAPMPPSNDYPQTLTGVNYIYSPDLERELKYSCTLQDTKS
jgi:hypothetical protein